MIKAIRVNSENDDFISLVNQLDTYLKVVDGDDHAFYNQYNKLNSIKYAVVVYYNEIPAGCGAIKEYSTGIMEIKRMYTVPEIRGKGVAKMVINELEKWAFELSNKKCILETGKEQTPAIGLYKKMGYKIIPNYGQYAGVENSICFEKNLI